MKCVQCVLSESGCGTREGVNISHSFRSRRDVYSRLSISFMSIVVSWLFRGPSRGHHAPASLVTTLTLTLRPQYTPTRYGGSSYGSPVART